MKFRIRSPLGAAAVLALAAAPALAQPVVLKFHHFLPATSNLHVNVFQPWCDKLAKASGDRMKCQIDPAMTPGGSPPQLIEQARDGVADIVWTLPTDSAGRFTRSAVFELPFLTRSAKGSREAFWRDVQKNALDEFKGVKPLWLHTNDGFSFHFGPGRSVAKPEDLTGLKIRSATRLTARLLAAPGATPVPMPLPGVSDAMAKDVSTNETYKGVLPLLASDVRRTVLLPLFPIISLGVVKFRV